MKTTKSPTDETFIDHCIFAIQQDKCASITFLQDKFSIGYECAKKIIAELEKRGIVGEPDTTGNRYKEPAAVVVIADCQERGMALRKEAAGAEIQTINEVYKEFDTAARGIETNSISAANLARELGIHLQTLCGHEQIDFAFWQKHCEGKLPFNFDSAKMFVSIARKMLKPATTLAEAISYIQQILIADGMLELPERTGPQVASVIDKLAKFLLDLTRHNGPWEKLIEQKPMETWNEMQLNSFIFKTEWIKVQNEKAAKLRHAKFKE